MFGITACLGIVGMLHKQKYVWKTEQYTNENSDKKISRDLYLISFESVFIFTRIDFSFQTFLYQCLD